MQDPQAPRPRPTVLSIGIAATSLLWSFIAIFLLFVGVLGFSAGGIAMVAGEATVPVGLAMGAGALVLLGVLLYVGLILLACARTWHGSRSWTIVLLVLSAVGLFNPGLFSTPIQILTIVGCAMALAQDERSTVRA